MKNRETKAAVKLMIQSGMVPEAVARQLVNWRLLPEASVESLGSHEVSLENEWGSVEEFLQDLQRALSEEMGTVRQTELDHAGEMLAARLFFRGETHYEQVNVLVDKLERVHLPVHPRYEQVEFVAISVSGTPKSLGNTIEHYWAHYSTVDKEATWRPRKVVRTEARHKGDRQVAWVCYLEKEGS